VNYDSERDTREHIAQVAARLKAVCQELEKRGECHDASKLGASEKPLFDAFGPTLRGVVYESDEYHETLAAISPALKHHYANNSHHPEHYIDGVAGMDLIDLVEMYCDWAASALRTKDGDFAESIKININRFGIGGPLSEIVRNTWDRYGGFCGQPEFNAPISESEL
jgi:hypothetical protein